MEMFHIHKFVSKSTYCTYVVIACCTYMVWSAYTKEMPEDLKLKSRTS